LFDIAWLAEQIRAAPQESIVCMTGAGISVSAGIPDFRSPGTGLYDNLQKYNLPWPTAVFELAYFRRRPEAFCQLAKELFRDEWRPTPTHHFLGMLQDRGKLLRCFTQNIDGLELLAGVDPDRLVQAHGGTATAHCIECGQEYDGRRVVQEMRDDIIPTCTARPDCLAAVAARGGLPLEVEGEADVSSDEKSDDEERAAVDAQVSTAANSTLPRGPGALVKPDITFFGEPLPQRFFDRIDADMPRARCLLVMGTSLKVFPFAGVIGSVAADCSRALLNRELVGTGDDDVHVNAAAAFDNQDLFHFRTQQNTRDCFLTGDCDATVHRLAELLGWQEELHARIAAGNR
jgi:NAD-dependent deacetylase sirtuin 2